MSRPANPDGPGRSERSMRSLIRQALVAAAAGCLVACGGGSGGGSSDPVSGGAGVERVDAAMKAFVRRQAPPGVAVAVARGGRLVFAGAYGSADLAGAEPLRPEHRFRVASVSKPVTGIAVLRAAEEGLLDLDDAAFGILADYLPAEGADPRLRDITVRHLLRHGGGWTLYAYPDDPLFRSGEIGRALGIALPPDPDALARWIATQPLAFDPGTGFAYTNIGFVVLGRVLERSTGYAYEDFVRRFVMAPAGIGGARLGAVARSGRLPDEVEYESFRDQIWRSVFDGATIVQEPAYGGLNLVGFDASSAWVMSVLDLVRLAAATDGDPAYPDIVSRASFAAMTRSATPVGAPAMGVAWFLGTDRRGRAVAWSHSGGMPGTTAFVGRLASGVIVAVASNTAGSEGFANDLIGSLLDAVNRVTDWPEGDPL